MTRWARFIAWVDADIYKASPSLKSRASLLFILPIVIALPLLAVFRPGDTINSVAVGLAGFAVALLYFIRLWRVVVNIRG